jgi:hypothetical protein
MPGDPAADGEAGPPAAVPVGTWPRRSDSVESVDYEGRTALIEIYSGRVALLNPTAGLVWGLCDGSRDFNQLRDELGRRFPGVSPDVLHRDLEAVLADLAYGEFIAWGDPE